VTEAAAAHARGRFGSAWRLEEAKARFSKVVRRAERLLPASPEVVPLVQFLEGLYVEGLDLTRDRDLGREAAHCDWLARRHQRYCLSYCAKRSGRASRRGRALSMDAVSSSAPHARGIRQGHRMSRWRRPQPSTHVDPVRPFQQFLKMRLRAGSRLIATPRRPRF
jgi:antitoxin Phd